MPWINTTCELNTYNQIAVTNTETNETKVIVDLPEADDAPMGFWKAAQDFGIEYANLMNSKENSDGR